MWKHGWGECKRPPFTSLHEFWQADGPVQGEGGAHVVETAVQPDLVQDASHAPLQVGQVTGKKRQVDQQWNLLYIPRCCSSSELTWQ